MYTKEASDYHTKAYITYHYKLSTRYKRLLTAPQEDKLLKRHRAWYSQFYSDSSSSLPHKKTLEW